MTPEAPTTEPDVRAVKMHRSMWEGDGMGLRTFDGRLITIDWREPDADGWWEPWFTASGTTEAERAAAIRAESSADVEAGWLRNVQRFLSEIERECSPLAEDPDNGIEYNEGICAERGRIAGILDSLLSPEALGLTAHPGENHEFRTACLRCGENGYLHVALITDREVVKVEARAALAPADAAKHTQDCTWLLSVEGTHRRCQCPCHAADAAGREAWSVRDGHIIGPGIVEANPYSGERGEAWHEGFLAGEALAKARAALADAAGRESEA